MYCIETKTQYCVDSHLAFSESLATVYSRILEGKNEKVFLLGNKFLSKLAKAILEQNRDLFAEACEKHADENYFSACAEALKKQGFIFEKGNKLGKDSWFVLYQAVLLLTEEYLATKCELPIVEAFECKENSESLENLKIIFAPADTDEEQLGKAVPAHLKLVHRSSNSLSINADFFEFLSKNFPCRDNEEELAQFLAKIYDEDICEDSSWLYQAIESKSLPIPSIATDIMEANIFGAYKDDKIYINRRLALDAMRAPHARFLLLLTMLHEYGHFLDDILHRQAGIAGNSEGEEGKAFADAFMEYSPVDLFNADFKFASIAAPNSKGEEQTFPLEISDLSYEQRRGISIIFEYIDELEDGNLELQNGEVIDNVKYFGLANLPSVVSKGYNAACKVHQNLTIAGAKYAGITASDDLINGCIWPDFPSEKELDIDALYSVTVLSGIIKVGEANLVYESHFGKKQYWHSMYPKSSKIKTNEEVQKEILGQLEEWYNEAIEYKNKGDKRKSLFAIGKLCHTIQDSFALSHCWRRYYGDEKFIGLKKIEKRDHGKIWSFQDYEKQDGNYHAMADSPDRIENTITIGYESAGYVTKEIMFKYSEGFTWHRGISGIGSPREFLEKVYEIYPGRENEASGGSHPWFKKGNASKLEVEDNLTVFSQEMKEWIDKT